VGLPGWLSYVDWRSGRLVRLTRSGVSTVLSAGGYSANVSPDGARVAFVDQNGNVVVADRDGKHRRTVLRGAMDPGLEPAWSPDSRRLLVGKLAGGGVRTGVVTVATGAFTALPHQLEGIHFLWSADGKHLGYATGECRIGIADADGGNARLVPVFGVRNDATNPQFRRSCDPYSVSVDGRWLAVDQRTGDEPDGDIGRDLAANAVVNTRTGDNVPLPVTGSISAVLFQPNGDILVRTKGATNRLTLLGPDLTVKAQVAEPARVKDLLLLAYTPS
jgi:TolB protein